MANLKISQLTSSSIPLAGTEVLPIVQSGSTVNVSVANLTAGRAVATAGGSFTDNITQNTAAKGINFITNTPAAGMTSRLLNWYEEGTFTPTVTASSGTITTVGSVSGQYTRIGRQVVVQFQVTITTNGTGAGYVIVSGLPYALNFFSGGTGRDNATGKQLLIFGDNFTATSVYISYYDGNYPGTNNGLLRGNITYTV